MSSTNGEEPPLKKKKPSTEPNSISSLPDDLIVSCLARVSRLHYPILSLVSKSFESHIASPEIYQTRSFLNRTEKCLYVCLQFPSDLNPRWFTLYKKPNQALNKKKKKESSSGYVLAPIRTLNSPIAEWSNLIAVGSNLYAIRATEESFPCSSNISFLDCRTHTWLEAPSMRIVHTDREEVGLYLPGSNENQDSSSLNCVEVFNTETQTWNQPDKRSFEPRKMEGKIYMKQSGKNRGVAYNAKESTWELVELDNSSVFCVIENVMYGYKRGFGWFDTKSDVPRKLKGLEGLPKFAGYSSVKLVDYGKKMIALWDKYVPAKGGYKEKMIWCAQISFEERHNGEEIWGKVEWVDAVLTVPKSYKFVYAIAATL